MKRLINTIFCLFFLGPLAMFLTCMLEFIFLFKKN